MAPPNHGMSTNEVYRALGGADHVRAADTGAWTSAVFVRDPLERFLSGWLSKCTDGHDLDREVCTQMFGAPDASFARAVEVIGAMEGDLPGGLAQDHFRR